jgi:DNA polymerase
MTKTPRATMDFETRSTVSLRKHGVWRYATHPTTEPLCFAFRLPHWAKGRTALWHPEFPKLGITQQVGDWDDLCEFWEWLEQGEPVEAHNAWFERNIWRHIMVQRFGWPEIARQQWRCSAAQAAALSLPRGLDDALAAIGLTIRKDATGSKVMMKMTKPRKSRKAEREAWMAKYGNESLDTLYFEDRHLLDQLFAYVRQDVLAEEALSEILPDLSADEQELYWFDQDMNDRGFQLDMEAVEMALRLLKQEATILNGELAELTEGQVVKATQRAQMIEWFLTQGLEMDDTQAATVDDVLNTWDDVFAPAGCTPAAKRGLEILRTLGRSSTSKYEAMKSWADVNDGRVRGGLLFHGASTGRWTGAGVQPHNFPKGTLKDVEMEVVWETLKTSDREVIATSFKNGNKQDASVLEVLAHALRGAIVASEGNELFVADYAAIEARVVLWLAEDEDALDIFRRGEDIYCEMAASIYNRKITKDDKTERGLGKIAILGLGYQMGAPKFVATCAVYKIEIDEELSKRVVDAYRNKFWRVKNMWADTEAAAIRTVKTGKPTVAGRVEYHLDPSRRFLYCRLPSGRDLAYPFPLVKVMPTSWGTEKETLTFMGLNSYTRQWERQKTYGGMLVENNTQAVARDLLTNTMQTLESTRVYTPILSVHDEAIAEARIGAGSVKQFEQLVKLIPDWAEGLPVEAEAWKGPRYHK